MEKISHADIGSKNVGDMPHAFRILLAEIFLGCGNKVDGHDMMKKKIRNECFHAKYSVGPDQNANCKVKKVSGIQCNE